MMKHVKNIGWGVSLLGLFLAGCGDDDKADAVQPVSELTLSGTDIVFDRQGGVKSFGLSTNRGWAVIRNDGEWVAVKGENTGEAGSCQVELEAAANLEPKSRKAKFTVSAGRESQELEFTQFGTDPEVIIANEKLITDCEGGMFPVMVNSNVYPLTVTTDGWQAIATSAYQSASNMYMVQVFANSGEERVGKIVFAAEGASDTLTVVQGAYEFHCNILENKLKVSALSESASVTLKVNHDWTLDWTDGKPDWVIGVKPVQGKAGESVKIDFTLKANTEIGASLRTVDFRINSGTDNEAMQLVQAEPVISDNGTRETDSLALVEFYTHLVGTKPVWDFTLPMEEWGPMPKGDGVVYALKFNSDGRVIGLNLYQFTVDGEMPEALGRLPLLRELTFVRLACRNMKFPATFGALKELQKLSIATSAEGGTLELPDMSGNTALYQIDILGLNPFFGECEIPEVTNMSEVQLPSNLEKMTLEYVNLGELPDLSVCRDLALLRVLGSDITRFPAELANCSKLYSLTLKECRLTGELPDVFTNTVLTTFDITSNQMSGSLPLAMFTSPHLSALRFASNNFTGTLPKELSTVSVINQFSCENNKLGGDGEMLPQELLLDERWKGTIIGGGGPGSGGWFGKTNICPQQPTYGWDNCN